MVDETTPTESQFDTIGTAPLLEAAESTPRTPNLALIVGAIVAFLVVAGLVAAAVFVFVLGGDDDGLVVDPVMSPVVTTSTVDPALGEPVEPAPVALSTVFTFRDIFDPLIKPLPEESETASPTPSPDGTPATDETTFPQGMLVLLDVVTEGDGYAGVFSWNGSVYTLSPGERIPDSPWQLVSASPSEAVMLYGDVRVTLTIGSRVVK